jgi:hypothetical protein
LREYVEILEKQRNSIDILDEITSKSISTTVDNFDGFYAHLTDKHGFIFPFIYRFYAVLLCMILFIESYYHSRNMLIISIIAFLVYCIGLYFDRANIKKGKAIF